MGKNKSAIEALKKSLAALEDADKAEDAVAPATEPKAPEAPATTSEEEKVEEAAEKAAKQVAAALGLDKLDKLFALVDKIEAGDGGISKMFSEKDVKKEVNTMTKEEKIIGFTKALLSDNKAVIKALSEGTAADGGNLFPSEFYAEIIKALVQAPRMRALVRVIPMRKDVMDIPAEGAKVTVSWGSENTAITTTTADFGTKQLTAYRMNSILYMSRELAEDATEIGVTELIIQQFAEAVGEEEDKVIIQGSGSGQPTGLTGATGHHEVTCSGNLDFDDVIATYYALPQQYRGNAAWLVNPTNVKELRQLKDTTNRYLWQDSVAAGLPPTILGRPVYEISWVPESSIFFGDYKKCYYLGDRQQMTVETTTEGGGTWEKHQVGIKVVERIAGLPVLPDALAELISIP